MVAAKDIIKKITTSTSPVHVFPDLPNWQKTYKEYTKVIHPDICKEAGSEDALVKLNLFKEELENGRKFKEDAGVVSYWINSCEFIGDEKLLATSFTNYKRLMAYKDVSSLHFHLYLPQGGKQLSTNELRYILQQRAIPLSQIGTLPQEHVNWILNRMLEFTGWLNQCGYCHCGINPDSIWIVPENHGIICTSFYHMKKFGTRLSTVSGKFSQLYPSSVFTDKKATPYIDVELAKRTAIFLLGDKSGTGTILRKTHNNEIIDFLQKAHYDPIECYTEHRALLRKYFDTKKFHILNI